MPANSVGLLTCSDLLRPDPERQRVLLAFARKLRGHVVEHQPAE